MLSELTQEAMTKEGWKFAAEYTETTSKGTRICVEYVKPAAQEPTFTPEQVREAMRCASLKCLWRGSRDDFMTDLTAETCAELAKEASNG